MDIILIFSILISIFFLISAVVILFKRTEEKTREPDVNKKKKIKKKLDVMFTVIFVSTSIIFVISILLLWLGKRGLITIHLIPPEGIFLILISISIYLASYLVYLKKLSKRYS